MSRISPIPKHDQHKNKNILTLGAKTWEALFTTHLGREPIKIKVTLNIFFLFRIQKKKKTVSKTVYKPVVKTHLWGRLVKGMWTSSCLDQLTKSGSQWELRLLSPGLSEGDISKWKKEFAGVILKLLLCSSNSHSHTVETPRVMWMFWVDSTMLPKYDWYFQTPIHMSI